MTPEEAKVFAEVTLAPCVNTDMEDYQNKYTFMLLMKQVLRRFKQTDGFAVYADFDPTLQLLDVEMSGYDLNFHWVGLEGYWNPVQTSPNTAELRRWK